MEQWAIQQMDAKFSRIDEKTFRKISGEETRPEEIVAWAMGDEEYFMIVRSDGAWNSRDYMFVLWRDGDDPCLVASLGSFPNRKEGVSEPGLPLARALISKDCVRPSFRAVFAALAGVILCILRY